MSDRSRIKVVSRLVEEIGHLTGGAFEQFAYKIMPLIQPGNWTERGTTIDGAPRKATVDTSAGGAAFVGEMSSASGYFAGGLTKPKEDLKHAIEVHDDVRRIWLLSSREAEAGQTSSIADLITDFRNANPSVESAEILDARAIAGHIYGHLGAHDLVRSIGPYLPSLERLADEHAFSHAIPSIAGITPRLGLESDVTQRHLAAPLVILQGISGAGKTALAARLAHSNKDRFDNVVWLDAREILGAEQLSSVLVTRSGLSHNIASLLKTDAILLVLDDPSFPLSVLENLPCHPDSRIIATTQVASGPRVIQVAKLEPAESTAILTSNVDAPCPDVLRERVVATVGSHPLTLRALNELARDYGWGAVDTCLARDGLAGLEDERHQIIFQRILKLHTALSMELQLVRWSGTARLHAEIFDLAFSSVSIEKLSKRGFLSGTTTGYVRIHDLVFRAILSEVTVTEESEARFRTRLLEVIRAEADNDRTLLQRIARTHSDLFSQRLHEGRDPALVYMVALSRSGENSIPLLGSPVEDAKALASRESLSDAFLEIRAIIEAVEALFTLRTDFLPKKEAAKLLEVDIVAFDTLLSHHSLSAEQRLMLEHHRAKMLVRLNRKSDAEQVFRRLIAEKPSFHAARIQLARLLPREAAVAECEWLLNQHSANPEVVSTNIVLEALRLLAFHSATMLAREDFLLSTIAQAVSIDHSVAVRLVATVAQRAWFTAPQVILPMFRAIPWDASPTRAEAFDWAQTHKYAAMAAADDAAARIRLLDTALRAYELAQPSNEYHRVHYAQALVLAGHLTEARHQLDLVPSDKRSAFWWERSAEVLAGQALFAEARAAIDQGIVMLGEDSLLPVFRAARFRILRALGDDGALNEADAAIGLLPATHWLRSQLETERADYVRSAAGSDST